LAASSATCAPQTTLSWPAHPSPRPAPSTSSVCLPLPVALFFIPDTTSDRVQPVLTSAPAHRAVLRNHLRLGAFVGLIGGFLLAYQRSSFRFWGWTENAREVEKDYAELSQRAREGKPLWGESDQPEWVQRAAHQNSLHSQLKLRAYRIAVRDYFLTFDPETMPWFNLVNHPYHGVDPAKYHPKDEANAEE
jgi:hypothetical protein